MELSTEKVFDCGNSDCEREKKHEMMLDLSLSNQKSENLFAGSDQTPTPTRLIRNCEEVGLFEDLRHVNPFDETFRRACEQQQSNGQTPIRQLDSVEAHVDENSLHTPQVYPQLEAASIQSCEMLSKPLDSPTSTTVTLDVPVVDELLNAAADAYKIGTSRQNSNNSTTSSAGGYGKIYKYRTIAERPVTEVSCIQLPTATTTAIQLIQPQLITLTFPDNGNKNLVTNLETAKPLGAALASNAIPIQTVKPFIMPKLAPATEPKPTTSNESRTTSSEVRTTTTTTTTRKKSTNNKQLPPLSTKPAVSSSTSASTSTTTTTTTTLNIPQPTQQHEPSSASLTPTSQLPIKERLKAILSQGNRAHSVATTPAQPTNKAPSNRRLRNASSGAVKYDEESMVRRRAAATRYRNKMRNEHKELRRRNSELQAENEKLRARIKQLEKDLVTKGHQEISQSGSGNLQTVPAQLQIPPSTLHLVMNIPTMVVPAGGQPSLIQPITYRVEKK